MSKLVKQQLEKHKYLPESKDDAVQIDYVSYPKQGMSRYKFVTVVRTRTDLDNTYLFSYYVEGLSPDEAAQHLLNNGWNSGVTGRYAFSDGVDCSAKVTEDWGVINWSKQSILFFTQ